ncbi:MAG TPA: CHAT domain-containing protein, partial [Ktedonobacteraceae bacterium]|nr:CHAT domain-containing protein [Ktedonobacteraceae bacterium]
PGRVVIYAPGEVLDWPWQRLHDGVWPLALRHPLVLMPTEREQEPAEEITVKNGPLRVLLTLASDEEHSALSAAVDQWIDRLEQRYVGRVVVRKVRIAGGYQGLLKVFRQALAPFHLWQHVGPCGPGLALQLGKDVLQVHDLNILLAQQRAACCMVLATHGEMPPASALSQLGAPFVLCQSARPGIARDLELLRGFYERLLTHDLAVAGTLGQLEAYLAGNASESRGQLTMVAQTTQLHLGTPRPVHVSLPGKQAPATQAVMLVLKANPPGAISVQEGLRIEQEINQIKDVLRENHEMIDLQERGAVRLQDFSRHLQRYQPALLHFSGHGTEEGELVLEKYASQAELRAQARIPLGRVANVDYIEYAAIARILVEYRATLRCVVFNACSTEPLAEAICTEIPCAIGMRGPINDAYAVRFAEIFYRSLSAGESVGLAFRKALSDVLSSPNARAETFQLKSRRGVKPDEVYIVSGRGGQS